MRIVHHPMDKRQNSKLHGLTPSNTPPKPNPRPKNVNAAVSPNLSGGDDGDGPDASPTAYPNASSITKKTANAKNDTLNTSPPNPIQPGVDRKKSSRSRSFRFMILTPISPLCMNAMETRENTQNNASSHETSPSTHTVLFMLRCQSKEAAHSPQQPQSACPTLLPELDRDHAHGSKPVPLSQNRRAPRSPRPSHWEKPLRRPHSRSHSGNHSHPRSHSHHQSQSLSHIRPIYSRLPYGSNPPFNLGSHAIADSHVDPHHKLAPHSTSRPHNSNSRPRYNFRTNSRPIYQPRPRSHIYSHLCSHPRSHAHTHAPNLSHDNHSQLKSKVHPHKTTKNRLSAT
ncbi:hypothetical protein AAMO2058_001024400 [Amorphochlora amoebiformis]